MRLVISTPFFFVTRDLYTLNAKIEGKRTETLGCGILWRNKVEMENMNLLWESQAQEVIQAY